MPAKYLVLGSNSFSGAAFVDYLLSLGEDVIGTSRSAEVAEPFRIYRWAPHPGQFRYHRIDINNDLDELQTLLDTERPTHFVNFAAQSMVGESWRNPDHWMMTNVVSTVRLHERLRHLDYLERYVHVTTPEVYGSTSGWIDENHAFNPSTPYAVSRAAGDMSLRTYFDTYGFPVLFTRAANVFGPGQQLYRIVPRTILFALSGKRLQLHGGGLSERSFIHAHDVASATHSIAEKGSPGETYHISTLRNITIRDLVEMILERLDKRFEDCVDVVGERLGKDQAYMLDTTKIRDALGWTDKIDLETGVDRTIEWVRRFQDDLEDRPQDYIHKR